MSLNGRLSLLSLVRDWNNTLFTIHSDLFTTARYSVLFEVLSLAPTRIIRDQSIVVTMVWFSLGEEGSPGSVLEAGPCLLFLEGHVPGSGRVARVNLGSAAPQCSLCVVWPRGREPGTSVAWSLWRASCALGSGELCVLRLLGILGACWDL